jgi:hypothetical protein
MSATCLLFRGSAWMSALVGMGLAIGGCETSPSRPVSAAKLSPPTTAKAGPTGYKPPTPGEHSASPHAFTDPSVVPLLAATATAVEKLVLPTVEELAAAGGKALLEAALTAAAGAALPVALTLALILGSSTPAGGPGIPQPHGLPLDPNVLRLNTLLAEHAAGTLAAADEAELIDLLARIKGIRVKSLADLNVVGSYKKTPQPLPGFHLEEITYSKRSEADTDVLRRKFKSSVRGNFMKKISSDPIYLQELRTAGFDDNDLEIMELGQVPDGWQVHHKLPLDDGGDNSFDNLLLIKNSPYHSVVTGYQKTNTGKLKPGQSKQLKWPTYNLGIVYPAKKP